MALEPRTKSVTTFKRQSNGDVVVNEATGSGFSRFASIAVGIVGAVIASSLTSWVTSMLDLDVPRYVFLIAWALLFSFVFGIVVPTRALLRVSADAVTVRLGQRPKQVIPITSIQYAEQVLLRSPDHLIAAPTAAAANDHVYGTGHGYAVRIHYVHEDFSVRSITFVTSETRRVLDALKQVGVRLERS